MERLRSRVESWEDKAENDLISHNDIKDRDEAIISLMYLDQQERNALKQKCRIKWAIEGDENSAFFHAILKNKGRKSIITGLNCNGVWTDNQSTIKHALEATITIEEVKEAVWSCEVDFEKTFDSVNWDFLLTTMEKMGFGTKWQNWVKSCLESATVSILINGSLTQEFCMERGLHQGDPLSLFLFLIVAKALQVLTLEAFHNGIFQGVSLTDDDGTNLSLLQYADDALFFGKWSLTNAQNLIRILKCFQDMSGLRINIEKSRLYGIGIDPREVESFSNILNCKNDVLLFVYLGLPVGKDMSRVDNWRVLIDRFLSKISSWKSKLLSVGGRVTLIKAVLGSLPLYYLSLFRAPIKESMLPEKNKGVLGIGSLKAKNLSLIGKWKWRFYVESEALWCKVVKSIHGPNGGFGVHSNSSLHKGVWANIVRIKDKYPRLFALETHQDCSIADRWKLQNGAWVGDWRRRSYLRGRSDLRGRFIDDLTKLSNHISTICLVDGSLDRWQWSLARNGHFSVSHLSKLVDNKVLDQAANNKLPTYCSLASKGINIPSSRCPLCNNGDETIDHIFCDCVVVKRLWLRCWDWWKVAAPQHLSIKDVIFGSFVPGGTKLLAKAIHAVLYVLMWSIWKWRNWGYSCFGGN
ncbi:putative RNA-directed DNA polymerase [Tanacetum coccineum]